MNNEMRRLRLMAAVCVAAWVIGQGVGCAPQGQSKPEVIVVRPETPELEETLKWYREAKVGMFIHWGLYSVIGQREWARLRDEIPDEEYRAIAERFNPVNFDADQWVRLAKRAGMRWITITAKHHDGFAIYPSEADGFDIEATPFGRDPLAELRQACDRHGLKLGFYYSQYQDWDHPNGGYAFWTYPGKTSGGFTKYMEEKAVPQVMELMERYSPFLFWFDTPEHLSPEESMRFRRVVHETSPGTMVNGRIGHGLGDYWNVGDNAVPSQPYGEVWETPMTTTGSWGWRGADHPLRPRPLKEVIQNLSKVVSYGGNVLLNVGPSPEGLIGEYEQELFGKLGEWLEVNGEAIYGTGMSPFYDSDYVCTTKPGKLYFHLFEWPEEGFWIERLRNEIGSAFLLADGNRLEVKREEGGVVVSLPREAPDKNSSILVVEIEGDPDVENSYRTNDADRSITIPAAEIVPVNERFGRFNDSTGVLAVLRTSRSLQNGQFHVAKPGRYKVVVEQAADAFQNEVYWVRINYQKLNIRVRDTGSLSRFVEVEAGVVEFEGAGVYNLTLQPRDYWIETDQVLVYLRSLRLVPEE
jgi:alpha-L-fucosidase